MKPNIIATLGNQFDYSDMKIIDELLENNVDYFRFNLSKYEDISALESRVKMISNIQRNYHNKIKIMLDLPFPGRKPRLYIPEKQRDVSKGEQIIFSSDKSLRMTEDIVFVDVEKFGKKVEECSDIVYADGEGSFKVLEKYDNNTAKVVANNSFIMYNTKSLSFNFFVTNNNFSKDYCDVISQIETEGIAFSFVTHAEEVLRIKEYLNTKSIISKIESEKGIANVDNIASVSNIMLGRGDLCLNANLYKLTCCAS